MKALLAVGNYPQLSETYIAAEISYFMRSGIQVRVWSPHVTVAGVAEQTKVYRGALVDAVRDFGPEVVHVHYLVYAREYARLLEGTNVQMTVRGHSYDFSAPRAEEVAAVARVRKIYLFPHFARMCKSPKVVPLPVAYDTTRYVRQDAKDWRLVVRLSAGKPNKGLLDFFKTAALCPEFAFTLASADVAEDKSGFFDRLKEANTELAGGRVVLLRNVPWEEAAKVTRMAGIYLDTSDPTGHPFGMPISVAESLATGALVLARRSAAAREYLTDAGELYDTAADAARIIKSTMAWSMEKCAAAGAAAAERAKAFADSAVLPRIVADWKVIKEGR